MKTMILAFPLMFSTLSVPTQAQSEWWKMGSEKKKPAATASNPASKPNAGTDDKSGDIKQRIKGFKNSGRFSVRYDKFRDSTLVSVGPFFIGGTKAYVMSGFQLEMSAHFFWNTEQQSQHVYLRFKSTSRDWKFLKDSELLALVDGERMRFGEGERDSDIGRRRVSESMIYTVPTDLFVRLGKAASAELKLGRIELALKDEHKEAFRDLLSLMR